MPIGLVQTPLISLNVISPAGMERVALEELRLLTAEGHKVKLYANNVFGNHPQVYCLSRLKKMNRLKEVYFHLKFLFLNVTTQILIGHNSPLLALLAPQRTYIYFHDEMFFTLPLATPKTRHRVFEKLRQWAFKRYNRTRFIFCSDYIRKRFAEKNPQIEQTQLFTLHSGVDVHRFVPRVHPRRPGPIRFSFHGRWRWYKGLHVLLEALRILKNRRKEFECFIAGGPEFAYPDTEDIRYCEKVKGEGKDVENVHFPGTIAYDKLPHYLQDMDVGVVPSVWQEPFGLVNLELMACGLPVIASKVGGIPEILMDGITGLLVDPNDPIVLSEAMMKLLDDSELRVRMGENARKVVEQEFSWNAYANCHSKICGLA